MHISFYETVPLTRDYYDELTAEEAQWIVVKDTEVRKTHRILLVQGIVVAALYTIICVGMFALAVIYLDIPSLIEMFFEQSNLFGRLVLALAVFVFLSVFSVRNAVKSFREYKKATYFYIAKGTILELNSEYFAPPTYQDSSSKNRKTPQKESITLECTEGKKTTMEMAVSDTQRLSNLDISIYQSDYNFDEFKKGTRVMVMYYPSHSSYYFNFYGVGKK